MCHRYHFGETQGRKEIGRHRMAWSREPWRAPDSLPRLLFVDGDTREIVAGV